MTDLTEIWIGAIVGTVPTYDPFTKKRTERNQKTDCVSSKRRIKIFLSGYPISFVPWRHATFLYRVAVKLTHLAYPSSCTSECALLRSKWVIERFLLPRKCHMPDAHYGAVNQDTLNANAWPLRLPHGRLQDRCSQSGRLSRNEFWNIHISGIVIHGKNAEITLLSA